MSIYGPTDAACKITFLTKHLFTFFVVNDIVHSQEKSMEGHLQFLFKVRVKVLETKYEAPNWNFVGGGMGLQIKKEHGGNMIFSGSAHYCKCKI